MQHTDQKNEDKRLWTTWFEIPVKDMDRAKQFYERIFDIKIQVNDFGNFLMGIFPHAEVGAALCKHESYVPAGKGTLVYLNANPDLSMVLDKVSSAGGHVLKPKTQISPEHGFMALFQDTEGNMLALHSDN